MRRISDNEAERPTTNPSRRGTTVDERPLWRVVSIPSEHGGWGLTLEPVLLGLLLAFSWPGAAIGSAAFIAFLVRTPLKLALIDRRRGRSLPRTRLAARVAVIELVLLVALASTAAGAAGWRWIAPVLVAAPLVAVELWFDVRSRSRRLAPELCGAVGISAVAAAIVIAGDGSWRLAVAAWMILAARSTASIPFVRTQIVRTRRRSVPLAQTDAFQIGGATLAIAACAVGRGVLLGTVVVAIVAGLQTIATRRPDIPAVKVIGLRQMIAGLAVVAATAIG